MENKNAKVTAVTLKKEGTGQYGKYYIFTVVFDNGDTGDFLAKSNPQTSFKVGENADYTKETVQNGQYTNVKIKPVNQQGGKFGSPLSANKRTALECAVKIGTGPVHPDILKNAEVFFKWLNGEQKSETKLPEPPPVEDIPEWLKD